MSDAVVLPLGEGALVIRIGEQASVEVAARAASLAAFLRNARIGAVTEIVSAVASVAVFYDDAALERALGVRESELRDAVAQFEKAPRLQGTFSTHEIPVRYNGDDLDDVASRTGLTREEVIERHTAREYHVMALGFLPGWAYLGTIDPAISLPRKATPRTRVPAGSVAIMGTQTGIYPRVSPGGWHLIGSTGVTLFDAERTPPALFAPGDRVRFVRID